MAFQLIRRLHSTWSGLTEKAKNRAKLNINVGSLASYAQLKETLLLPFTAQSIKWVMERELYGKIQETKEDSLNFIMKNLELIEKLQLGFNKRENFELIVPMLPSTQEVIELTKAQTYFKINCGN